MRRLLLVLVLVLCAQIVLADVTKQAVDALLSPEKAGELSALVASDPAGVLTALGPAATQSQYKSVMAQAFNKLSPDKFQGVKDIADAFFKTPGNLAGQGGQNYVNFIAGHTVDIALPSDGFVTIDPALKLVRNGQNMPVVSLDNLQAGTKITPNAPGQGFCVTIPGFNVAVGSCGITVKGDKSATDSDVAITTKDGHILLTRGGSQVADLDGSVKDVTVQRVMDINSNNKDGQRYKISITYPSGDQVVVSTKGLQDTVKFSTGSDGVPGIILSEGQIASLKVNGRWDPIRSGGTTLVSIYGDHYTVNSWGISDYYVNTAFGLMHVAPPKKVLDPATSRMVDLASLDTNSLEFKRNLPEVWIGKTPDAQPSNDEMLKAGIPTVFVTADALHFSGKVQATVENALVGNKRTAAIDAGNLDYAGQEGYLTTFKATKNADGTVKPILSIDGVPSVQTVAEQYAVLVDGKRLKLTQDKQTAESELASLQQQRDSVKEQLKSASGDEKDTLKNTAKNLDRTIDKRKDDLDKIGNQLDALPQEKSGDNLVLGRYKLNDVLKAVSKDPLNGPQMTLTRNNEMLSMDVLSDAKKRDNPDDATHVKMVVDRTTFVTPAFPVTEAHAPVEVDVLGTPYRTIAATGMTDEKGKTVHFDRDLAIQGTGDAFTIKANELQLPGTKLRLTDFTIASGKISREGDNDVLEIKVPPNLQDQGYGVQGEGFKMAVAFFLFGKDGVKSRFEQGLYSQLRDVSPNAMRSSVGEVMDNLPGPKEVPQAIAAHLPDVLDDLQRQMRALPTDYKRLGDATVRFVAPPMKEGETSGKLDIQVTIDAVNGKGQTRTVQSSTSTTVNAPTDQQGKSLGLLAVAEQNLGTFGSQVTTDKPSILSPVIGSVYYVETSPDMVKKLGDQAANNIMGTDLQDKLATNQQQYDALLAEGVNAAPPQPAPTAAKPAEVPPATSVPPAGQQGEIVGSPAPSTPTPSTGTPATPPPSAAVFPDGTKENIPPNSLVARALQQNPVFFDSANNKAYILSNGQVNAISTVDMPMTKADTKDLLKTLGEDVPTKFAAVADGSIKMTIKNVQATTVNGQPAYIITYQAKYDVGYGWASVASGDKEPITPPTPLPFDKLQQVYAIMARSKAATVAQK